MTHTNLLKRLGNSAYEYISFADRLFRHLPFGEYQLVLIKKTSNTQLKNQHRYMLQNESRENNVLISLKIKHRV